MTKQQSGGGAERPDEPEKGSAAVQVETEAATDRDDTEVVAKTESETKEADAEDFTEEAGSVKAAKRRLDVSWSRVLAFGLLPGLALLIAAAAGFLGWHNASVRGSELSSIESVAAAKDSTVALLSYQADSAEKDLGAARDRLTGTFKESYTQLTHDVVIPGAKQKHISAIATIPAASSVSATSNHAVTLLFVDQTVTIGNDAPTDSISSVRATLDKIGGRWLISGFDPV